ncbi:MAG: DUF3352 domain-containing protein [Symploca sp. SIO2C1]|nr:DUF3352 domain-containing protein [Symploca sp. SIO2C1]
MKKNRLPLLLASGVAVLLISGGVAAYFQVQRHLLRGRATMSAQLVPEDALVTASISTDIEKWQKLQKYGTPETKAALKKQLTQLKGKLLKANGYNYEEDIQPWLGETVMIAYLASGALTAEEDTEQETPLIKQPDLIVLPIEDPVQAKQLLTKANSKKQLLERTYKGIQIRETKKNQSQQFSAAVLGRFFVVTKNSTITEQVIDTYTGEPSVAETPGYTKALSQIQASKPFAQLYLNMPTFSATAATNSGRSLSPENIAAAEPKQGIATTVTLESKGINFRSISWLKPDSNLSHRVENRNSSLVKRLPADTLLMLSGGNLEQLWRNYLQGAESNLLAPIPPETLTEGLKGTLDLDWEEDLLPWMGGEFLLGIIPAYDDVLTLPDNSQFPQLGAGVVFMVLSRNRFRAEKSFQKLDEVMATRYQFLVEETELEGKPIVNWKSPLGGISATHGWLEKDVAFLTFGAPITSSFFPQPEALLTQTPLFKAVVPTKPNPNNGQFFLNFEGTINSSNLNMPELPPKPQMLAQAINAIGVTAAVSDERTTRFDILVEFKTAATPSTSPKPKQSE